MSPSVRQRIRWIAGLWLAWTVAGLLYITQETVPRLYRGEPVPWNYVFIGWMAAMYVCAALTPAVLWLGRRWPIERLSNAGLHFCFSVVFSLASSAIEAPTLLALGVFPAATPPASIIESVRVLLSYGIQGGVIRYFAVVAIQAVYRSQENAERREREAFELKVQSAELARQLTTAQLSALKMQLQPHFLFNTLGAIMVLIQQQRTTQAEAMVARLGDLLRFALDDVETQEVPLWRELEFLRLYLSIEQVRFEDRLRVRIAAEPDVTDALVPHMVLQPIVENAVRHGLGQSEDAVTIDVTAAASNGALTLVVSDDGPGLSSSGTVQAGIGLTNTRNRLTHLYGDEGRLALERETPRGVRVTVRMPYRTASSEAGPSEATS
jgi:two-component system LytT family sensor kinase